MTKGRLPDRPHGVRRSWVKHTIKDLGEFGEYLRRSSWMVQPGWGDPTEVVTFRERKGNLRRIEAMFANGRRLSISRRRDGTRIERISLRDFR